MERQSVPVALLYCLVNWLVPGAGFLLAKDYRRGWLLFALLNGCFVLGLALHGTANLPSFHWGSPTFNIVAVLSFLVQIWHGGGTLLLLAVQHVGGPLAGLLLRDPGWAYADLGTFHLLVAGGLNYFATVRLYDLLAGDPSHGEADEAAEEAEAS
ncbi:hypothetical protein KQI84_09880 [bacterium]|nr:hypothetical protein [bacterium]